MSQIFKECEEKYNQIEEFVNNHKVLKTLQLEKITSNGKWAYAFIITEDNLDFPYRDNVRSSSVNEITCRLISFAETVEKAQEVVRPYVNYFSSKYNVSVNLFADRVTLIHKETNREYIINLKEDGITVSRLIRLRPKTDNILISGVRELEFLVKLEEYSHINSMSYVYQAMEDEKEKSLVDYLNEI